MEIIVASVLMLSMLFVAVSQIVRNMGQKALLELQLKVGPAILFSGILIMLTDALASGMSMSYSMMAADILPSAAAIWLVASSFSESRTVRWTVRAMLVFNIALLTLHVFRLTGNADMPQDRLLTAVISLFAVLLILIFIHLLAHRMRDVKSIMKNGVVWAVVCLVVDVVYLFAVLAAAAAVQAGFPMIGTLLLGGAVTATGVRIMTDSKFLVWQKQERIIIESMKVTSLPSATDASRIEEVYKDIYDRVVAYFETEKPFLDSDLTINMIVKKLYSNKLYLSRAISQFTGRNFCQFVNYYRVMHAVDTFRHNPDLKVHELALMCGFNTVVSFNMAFRLFMGENPSEWCRKERSRLIKTEK